MALCLVSSWSFLRWSPFAVNTSIFDEDGSGTSWWQKVNTEGVPCTFMINKEYSKLFWLCTDNIAQWIMSCMPPNLNAKFDPWKLHGRRREPIPASFSPDLYTCVMACEYRCLNKCNSKCLLYFGFYVGSRRMWKKFSQWHACLASMIHTEFDP